jgi:AcrR family transcriptional regulator
VGIAERKQREKEKRRRSILEAARKLIQTKSYDEITMDEIARELELARATLYLYFSNKNEIYLTLLTEGLRDLLARYTKALQGSATSDPMANLARMGGAFFEFYKESHSFFDLLVTKRQELTRESRAEVQEDFARAGQDVIQPIAEAYQKGVQDGKFIPADPAKMAYLLRAIGIGMAVGFREGNLQFPADLALLETMLKDGIVRQ